MSNPSSQPSKVLYRWGVRRRGKTGKHGKVGVKRKCRVLAQPPFSPQGNKRKSPKVELWNLGDIIPDEEENQGGRYRQRFVGQARPRSLSRYIHVKQEQHDRGPPDPPTIKPRLTPTHFKYQMNQQKLTYIGRKTFINVLKNY